MVETLLSLPDLVGGVVVMTLTTVAGLLVYVVSNKLILRYQKDDLKDPTSSVFRVVGVLVSLMLSLAFLLFELILQVGEHAAGHLGNEDA